MPPPLSYGLNLPSKNKPAGGQKRKKTIFDDESDDDSASAGQQNEGGEVEIGTVGGIQEDQSQLMPNPGSPLKKASEEPPPKRKPLFTTKTAPAKKPGPKPLSKNSIFADDEDDGGTTEEQLDSGGLPLGLNASKPKSKPTSKATTADDPSKTYTNLSALHSSKKHAQEAQDLDPTIYSYDAVYDSLHAKPDKATAAGEGGKSSEVPKYMTSLLRSAEVRKRDQLRARDRLLAREREAEGDEFADKEKFVTSAYKAQQEEMQRIEREDAEREQAEEERQKKQGNVGMVGFYRDMLSRGEERHEEVRKAAEEAAEKIKAGDIPKEGVEADADGDGKAKEPSETQRAAELNAQGAHIAVNDEGQVVDKRQLLSAGLNVAPKPKPAPSAAASARKHDPRASGPAAGGRRGETDPRAGQRARQTEMIAAQLEERTRAEAEAEEARQKEIAERNRSRKSEGEVSSAKERYLARKREREQAGK